MGSTDLAAHTKPAELGRSGSLRVPLCSRLDPAAIEQGTRGCRTNGRYQGAEQRRRVKSADEQHDNHNPYDQPEQKTRSNLELGIGVVLRVPLDSEACTLLQHRTSKIN